MAVLEVKFEVKLTTKLVFLLHAAKTSGGEPASGDTPR
jgi:hypothetical protein